MRSHTDIKDQRRVQDEDRTCKGNTPTKNREFKSNRTKAFPKKIVIMQTQKPQPQSLSGQNNRSVAVIGQQFCAPYPVQLTLQRKGGISFSGDNFKALDSVGNLLFTVEGPAFSYREKRILRDQAGIPLLTMRRKLMTIRGTWEAYRGEGTEEQNLLFIARRSNVWQWTTSLNVYLGSSSQTDFKVKSSYLQRSCTIYQGATAIAEIARKYTVSNVLSRKDTYAITVHPGIDQAFVVALTLLLHEISESSSTSNSSST